jgi:hypothetical protein
VQISFRKRILIPSGERMNHSWVTRKSVTFIALVIGFLFCVRGLTAPRPAQSQSGIGPATVTRAKAFDTSPPLRSLLDSHSATDPADCIGKACGDSPRDPDDEEDQKPDEIPTQPAISDAGAAVEQTSQGKRPSATLAEKFEGLGATFESPKGGATFRNPSDNSLAVGPNHIVQIVNSRLAVYTKKGARYPKSGTILYGDVPTNTIFNGFSGVCGARNNGDAVVRYDQLANRWLIVMPIFSRIAPGQYQENGEAPIPGVPATPGRRALPGQAAAAGAPVAPPANPPQPPPPAGRGRGQTPGQPANPPPTEGTYAMCYAVSVSDDPLGAYYRYAFERALFPDYPRPAIWPDGYYVPSSTGDTVIQKHDCIADRTKMLAGQPATEQCIIIDGVNFLNNADVDGQKLPPPGAPNIMLAAGGTQLKNILDDDGIYSWSVHVDWQNPANTKATGPVKISVAPYHFLCGGQLTNCVPQPDTDRRLDAQGDKLMQRLVYRRIGNQESIVAAHSISTKAGGGGVRWYEFRLDKKRDPYLYQQGTYAPEGFYRWMPSIAMDKKGNIGVGYSFGGTPNFAGQRFASRLARDPKGTLTLHETVLVNGEASQTNTLRWEDYATTAIDPSDDCTFWYVGDYIKAGGTGYSSRIGSFRLPGCSSR